MKPEDISLYWESVVDNMVDGLLIVDTEGTIVFINPAAEKITGYKNEEVAGHPCTVFESDTCMMQTTDGKIKSCNLFKHGEGIPATLHHQEKGRYQRLSIEERHRSKGSKRRML